MTRKTKGEQEAVEAEQRRGDVQAEQLQNLLFERLDEVITDAFRGQDVEIAMDALLACLIRLIAEAMKQLTFEGRQMYLKILRKELGEVHVNITKAERNRLS